ncbi:MAG: IBR domain-containing protein [archaeon]|nr:IBR domain-containing protein [archaeon]
MASGRDALRFTTFVPLLEEGLTDTGSPALQSLGTLPDLMSTTERLLMVALEQGQEDRVERLLQLQSRLEALEAEARAMYGEDLDRDLLRVSALHPAGGFDDEDENDINNISISGEELPTSQTPLTASEASASAGGGVSECPICFEEFATGEGRGLASCKHLYCHGCLAQHFQAKISENAVSPGDLTCPQPGCVAVAFPRELEALVEARWWEMYTERARQAELRGRGAMRWCPNVRCGAAVEGHDGQVGCPSCGTVFCGKCQATPYHAGKGCDAAGDGKGKGGSNEPLIKYMHKVGTATKPCPQCGDAIEKDGGCNHIVCITCHYEWCWLCRREYHCVEFGHYNSGRCKGLQFCPVNSIEEIEALRSKKKTYLALTICTLGLASPLLINYKKQYPDL